MAWKGVITNAGNTLLQQWTAGATLIITKAAAGSGTVDDTALLAQVALKNQKQIASIVGHETLSTGQKIRLQITAPETGYTLNQFGVWAKLGTGEENLLAIFQNADGIAIPSSAEFADFIYTFYALLAFSNTGTLSVTIDASATVTFSTMIAAIDAAIASCQPKIMAAGILKGNGDGDISAAVAGTDYGLPLKSGAGSPTATTAGTVGQHYFDTETGKEYVCVSADASVYTWKLAGATDAADIRYNDGILDAKLDAMNAALSASKPLTGAADPANTTSGGIGQHYVNTSTGAEFVCTAINGGLHTWRPVGDVLKSTKVNITLTAANWSNGTYTLSNAAITATCPVELLPRESGGITADQFDALADAKIVGGAQAAGSIVLKALGDTPTIDIPVTVIIRGDL